MTAEARRPALAPLYTTQDLAQRYGCKPRAVAEKASREEWPATKVLNQWRFTPEMVAWIDAQHEQWPQNQPAPAPQQPKPQQARKPRQRRTPQPPPPAVGSNVRRLVAKPRPNPTQRSA